MSKKQDEKLLADLITLAVVAVIGVVAAVFSIPERQEGLVRLDDTNDFEEGDLKRSEAREYGWRFAWIENRRDKNLILFVAALLIPFVGLYYLLRGVWLIFRKTGRLYEYKKEALHRRDRRYKSGYRVEGWRKVKCLISSELTKAERIFQISKGVFMVVFSALVIAIHFNAYSQFGEKQIEGSKTAQVLSGFSQFEKPGIRVFQHPDNKSTVMIRSDAGMKYKIIDETNYFYKIKLKDAPVKYGYVLKSKMSRTK